MQKNPEHGEKCNKHATTHTTKNGEKRKQIKKIQKMQKMHKNPENAKTGFFSRIKKNH